MILLVCILYFINIITILSVFSFGKTPLYWIGVSIPFILLECIICIIDFYQKKKES